MIEKWIEIMELMEEVGRGCPAPLKFDDKSSHDLPVWMEPDMVSQKKTKEVNYTGVVQCANRDGKH